MLIPRIVIEHKKTSATRLRGHLTIQILREKMNSVSTPKIEAHLSDFGSVSWVWTIKIMTGINLI